MTRIVWSFFIIIIAFYNLNDDSAFWKKTQSFLAQKGSFIEQLSLTKDESFLKSIFDLNETCEMVLT